MFFNEYRELYITVVIVIYRITVRFKTNQFFIAKLCVKIFKEPTQKAYIEYNLSEWNEKSEPEMQVLTFMECQTKL